MELNLYDTEFSGGDIMSFCLDDMDMSDSLLDDDHMHFWKKLLVQRDVITDVKEEGSDHDLFPDLLPIVHDPDPLAADWMEHVDLSHFTDTSTFELDQKWSAVSYTQLPLVDAPTSGLELLQNLLEETQEQLTPPVSPEAQVAPEIDLIVLEIDPQVTWDAINSPLTPQEIERVLTPSPTPNPTPVFSSPLSSPISSPAWSPSPSSRPSPTPSPVQLETIDSSQIEFLDSKTARPKPYHRPQTVSTRKAVSKVKTVHVDTACELDFSFRKEEKLSKKEKKKLQNKNAATRYRQKKKTEASGILSEEDLLEKRNKELKEKVEQISREISCMKEVLGDIYKGIAAKGRKP